MKETDIKQDSLKAWLLAARPKTLTGAAVPVIIGLALAGLVGAIGFVVIARKVRRKNGN